MSVPLALGLILRVSIRLWIYYIHILLIWDIENRIKNDAMENGTNGAHEFNLHD